MAPVLIAYSGLVFAYSYVYKLATPPSNWPQHQNTISDIINSKLLLPQRYMCFWTGWYLEGPSNIFAEHFSNLWRYEDGKPSCNDYSLTAKTSFTCGATTTVLSRNR
ncbi:hypothetical protein EJ08DRAFT_647492 [Tothia fuscella]|uniref:Uncharacterized protein n=1 Tax=Tothia fuscella TaxID=1048955 RepID=A0A9P4NXU0_9PEZI|nr:hypothetical protein EJ08DRAFT_647492 [Tothia fuscella]